MNETPNESDGKIHFESLPAGLREHLRQLIENELFSKHPQFIKCSNHLHEFKWLTEHEIDEQHEFYPHQDTFFEKISRFIHLSRKPKIPDTPAVRAYSKIIKEELARDIKQRLEKDHQKSEEIINKRKERIASAPQVKADKSFYHSNPDYKLYQNHLGETRWMTREEFESQDEFTVEVIPLSQKIKKVSFWLIPAIIVFSTILLLIDLNREPLPGKGYLLVESNISQGQLYVNETLKLGVSLNQPLAIPEGNYQIIYRKAGFSSYPPFQQIEITDGDTTRIQFALSVDQLDNTAVVRLKSAEADAKVFVNNEFYGIFKNNQQLSLAPGDYRIALKKENYTVLPPFADISLSNGDSIYLPFSFSERAVSRTRKEQDYGLIEVRSNINEAKIYLNGSYSGYNTDYIFNKVPLGTYKVALELNGYSVYPKEKTVNLTTNSPHQIINFRLRRSQLAVTFKTTPITGDIYLNGEKIGSGLWQGSLTPGRHQLTFGRVDHFQVPQPVTLEINEESPTEYTFKYLPIYTVEFSPNGILPDKSAASIQMGYVDEDNIFVSNPKNAPEIVKIEGFSKKVWSMGYAFAYRNPPENDAILFSFDIPPTVDLSRNLWLKMWGYRTEENYPMEFNSVSEIRISVNNRMIQKDYTPEFSIEQASDSRFERFRINNLLGHGKNRILISTGPLNTTFFALWKIGIE